MLSCDWDIDIPEKEAEFYDDLRAASGIGERCQKVPPYPEQRKMQVYPQMLKNWPD